MPRNWNTHAPTAAAVMLLTVSALFFCTFVLLPRSVQALPSDLAELRLSGQAEADVASLQGSDVSALAIYDVDGGNALCSDVTGSPYCTIQAAVNAAPRATPSPFRTIRTPSPGSQ